MSKNKVFVAYPAHGAIDPQFHSCLMHLMMSDAKSRQNVEAHMMLHTTNLPHARNQIVRMFLDNAKECDWLWFVDTDQTFAPDTLDRMLAVAHPTDRPVIGVLVYSYNVNEKEQRAWPTIWTWAEKGPGRWSTAPRNTLLRVDATGTGCVLIHRSVFETVFKAEVPGRPGVTFGETSWPWFQFAEWSGEDGKPDVMGEDLTFMSRVGAAGIPIHVDTSIRVGHMKPIEIDEAWHLEDLPFERRLSENYVVIPVRDRVELTQKLLYQLRDQGHYSGIFVYDNGSNEKTKKWLARQTIAEVFDAPGAGIHQMWNAGIVEALERWPKANVAILNNDLRIGDHFLEGLANGLRTADDNVIAVAPNYDGRTFDGDLQLVQGISAGRYDGTGGFPGFAFMVKGEAFAAGLPLFDEQFEYWYGDNDWLLTIDRLGGKYGIVRDITVEHVDGGSQTDRLFAEETEPKKARDRERFVAKWEPLGVRLAEAPVTLEEATP